MRGKDRSKFRPSNIRKKLPDENKDIQSADLSDILRSLSNINLITKTAKDARRRGRSSSKDSEDEPSERGIHSFYQPTEYLESLKQVISKPVARKLIFSFLLESKLIHKWLDFNCLLALHIAKFSNIDTVKNIDRAVGIIQDELKNLKLHNDVSSLTDEERLHTSFRYQPYSISKSTKKCIPTYTSWAGYILMLKRTQELLSLIDKLHNAM